MDQKIIAPSIFAGNHSNLQASLDAIDKSGVGMVHLDIMDGHFVPNLSFGPETVAELRTGSDLFFDVHLMLMNPEGFVKKFIDAGADGLTIHAECSSNISMIFNDLRSAQRRVGLAINPGTGVDSIVDYLCQIDVIVVMSVWPGFCGQKFESSTIEKIKHLAEFRKINDLKYFIEVDGGINAANSHACYDVGADILVVGTSFFEAEDRHYFIKNMKTK
ncbi:MAG: ribulose-phosphate 3-epimerase [Puniceicoccales bacterium]|jgi:ribulose-phosphate 3-epimerase|nr:ribulose-phosphate 3-epimerase [Puniceicoccales bacterium]